MNRLLATIATSTLAVVLNVGSALGVELDYRNALHAYMKLDVMKLDVFFDAENAVESYMMCYRSKIWQQNANDEFELAGKRKETKDMMEKAVSTFRLDQVFTITANAQFDEYDFAKGQFAFRPFTETSYFSFNSRCGGDLPSSIKVFMKNTEAVDGLPMPQDQAKSFLASRKTSYGVNRDVLAVLDVVLTEFRSDNELTAEIRGYKIVDNSGRAERVLHSSRP